MARDLKEIATTINEVYGQSKSGHVNDLSIRARLVLGDLLNESKEMLGNDVWLFWLITNTSMRPHKALCLMRWHDKLYNIEGSCRARGEAPGAPEAAVGE